MSATESVAIVVDENYSTLPELASRMAVWVIDSPSNRKAMEKLWNQREKGGNGLTLFKATVPMSKEAQLLCQIMTVELHFPQSNCFVLLGVGTSSTLRDELLQLGYVLEEDSEGLLARKSGERASK